MKWCSLVSASLGNGWTDLDIFFLIVCNDQNEVFMERKKLEKKIRDNYKGKSENSDKLQKL
jgi:hypothetical protein